MLSGHSSSSCSHVKESGKATKRLHNTMRLSHKWEVFSQSILFRNHHRRSQTRLKNKTPKKHTSSCSQHAEYTLSSLLPKSVKTSRLELLKAWPLGKRTSWGCQGCAQQLSCNSYAPPAASMLWTSASSLGHWQLSLHGSAGLALDNKKTCQNRLHYQREYK